MPSPPASSPGTFPEAGGGEGCGAGGVNRLRAVCERWASITEGTRASRTKPGATDGFHQQGRGRSGSQ